MGRYYKIVSDDKFDQKWFDPNKNEEHRMTMITLKSVKLEEYNRLAMEQAWALYWSRRGGLLHLLNIHTTIWGRMHDNVIEVFPVAKQEDDEDFRPTPCFVHHLRKNDIFQGKIIKLRPLTNEIQECARNHETRGYTVINFHGRPYENIPSYVGSTDSDTATLDLSPIPTPSSEKVKYMESLSRNLIKYRESLGPASHPTSTNSNRDPFIASLICDPTDITNELQNPTKKQLAFSSSSKKLKHRQTSHLHIVPMDEVMLKHYSKQATITPRIGGVTYALKVLGKFEMGVAKFKVEDEELRKFFYEDRDGKTFCEFRVGMMFGEEDGEIEEETGKKSGRKKKKGGKGKGKGHGASNNCEKRQEKGEKAPPVAQG